MPIWAFFAMVGLLFAFMACIWFLLYLADPDAWRCQDHRDR